MCNARESSVFLQLWTALCTAVRGLSVVIIFSVLLPTSTLAETVFVTDDVSSIEVTGGSVVWNSKCGGEFDPPLSHVKSKTISGSTILTYYGPSTCQSDRVASYNVTSDRGVKFWATADSRIVRMPTWPAIGPLGEVALTAGVPQPFDLHIAVLGNYVYWNEGGNVFRALKEGGGARALAFGILNPIIDLQSDGDSHLFFRSSGNLSRALDTGLEPPLSWSISSRGRATAYTLGNGRVYWADGPPTGGDTVTIRSEPIGGGTAQVHATISSSGSPIVDAMAVDEDQLYWIERRGPTGPIMRIPLSGGTPEAITGNLSFFYGQFASSGRYLFWAESTRIMKLGVNAAAVTQDLAAEQLEVVQVVQDQAQTTSLIGGKITYARLFGRIVASSSGMTSVRPWPIAHLRGFRGGIELPESPLQPLPPSISNPFLSTSIDRTTLNQGLLFRLPDNWTTAGPLELRGEINPNRVLLETNYDNNEIVETLSFEARPAICGVVMPVRTPVGSIGGWNSARQTQFDRAEVMLPTPELRIYWPGGEPWEEYEFPFSSGPYEVSRSDNDTGKLLTRLVFHDIFRDDPDECDNENARTHQIVMIPFTHPNPAVNGSALGDSLIFFVQYGLDPSNSRQNSWAGGVTLAHELGHNYERDHVNCSPGDPADPDGSYPYPNCQIDFIGSSRHVGFDPFSRLLIPPGGGADLMSYGHRASPPILRWPSDYTWEGIHDDMDTPPAGAAATSVSDAASTFLLVSGRLEEGSRLAVFDYAFPVEGNSLAKANALLAGAGPSNEFALWLLNGTGGLIQQVPVSILTEAESPVGDWGFAALIDAASGAARVTVRDLVVPRELGALNSGDGVPTVAVSSPTSGEVVDGTLKIEWSATDTDGDVLRFTVRYSADMGSTWLPLAYQTPFTTLTRSTQGLPSCTSTCLIEVMASDGLHTATIVSDPFTVLANSPDTAIFFETAEQFGITGRAVVKQSDEVILHGRGYSSEDGPLTGANLQWLLEGPEARAGQDRRFLQRDLVPGEYAVKLTALASTGLKGVAYATLVVEPKSVPDSAVPRLDGFCDDIAYPADRDPIGLRHSAGIVTQLRMVHADNALFACFSGIPSSLSGPDIAGLRIDPDANGDIVAGPADFVVVVDENEILGMLEGDGAGGFTPITVLNTVDARVSQNDETWSAEFRIDGNLFGGWGGLSRMQAFNRSFTENGEITTNWPAASDEGSPATWGEVKLGIPRRVIIDIKPGEFPNYVDPTSTGVAWVAVLSTPELDATSEIDLPSLVFGPGMAPPQGSLNIDVNSDLAPDLLLQFAIPDTGIQSNTAEACLEGTLNQGASDFVACDAIIAECDPEECDFDKDGTSNVNDNCILVENPDQSDMDGDSYGDLCDADLNNDGIADSKDLGVFADEYGFVGCGGNTSCLADFDEDGDVDAGDLDFLISIGIETLGPSGLVP